MKSRGFCVRLRTNRGFRASLGRVHGEGGEEEEEQGKERDVELGGSRPGRSGEKKGFRRIYKNAPPLFLLFLFQAA